MKKISRTFAAIMAVITIMCCTVPALAVDARDSRGSLAIAPAGDSVSASVSDHPDSGVAPLVSPWHIPVGGQFVTVIGNEVRNATVYVDVHHVTGNSSIDYNPKDYRVDIMVYSAKGLIWGEEDWMKDRDSASFWIGTDVTAVTLRIVPRPKLFPAPQRTFEVQIAY